MLDQDAFYLDWTDPHAADLQHVIGPSGVPEISVFILVILVAGSDPMSFNRVLSLFVLVPVISPNRVSSNQQIARLPLRHRTVIVVRDSGFESGDYRAAGARAHSSRTIGDHHVQSLG